MSKILRKLGLKKPTIVDYWDCSKLNLYDLPKEVLRHRQTLKSLFINNNHIRDIPKTIFMLDGLEELEISENDILFIPPGITKLKHLTTLVISKNSLASVPDAIRQCEQLLSLDLSINPLGSLCEGVTELRQLRRLILNDTQLEEIPPNIGKLSKLEVLELRENMLQTLPSSMSHLTLLEKLDIGNNEFVALPTVVGSLESLCELWLDTNTINSIPEELGNLHNLRFLEMSENHIVVLPSTISGWVKLTDLYANENLLSILPDTFGELSSLTIAKLNSNRLGGLPDTVYGLTSMVELDLSHNHITELPASIGGMTSLVSLNIDENLLTTLPPQIGNCILLKYLFVRDNQLFDIPSECCGLTDLRILNVIGNRLTNLPYSLTSLKHLSAIWVVENQSRPIVELQVEMGDRGDRWLTCFLFPQQGRESPYEEATSPLDAAADEDPSAKYMSRKGSQVNFDPRVLDRRSKLNRDPTPFPKELHNKAMQWRAARDIHPEAPPPDEHSPQPERMALRNPPRRFVKNRYSLLKALSNPLDEDLKPASGRRLMSPSSPETPPYSPPAHPQRSVKHPDHAPMSPGRYSPSANTQSQSSDLHVPLPPVHSPNGSVSTALSGPYLDPPSEFAASVGAPSPITAAPNGGIPQFPPAARTGSPTGHMRSSGHEIFVGPHGSPNSNNNNNRRMGDPSYSISLGAVSRVRISPEEEEEPINPPPLRQVYFLSQASNLSRSSDIQETRSSMESGFDADTELENQQQAAWYLSPNASPKSRRRSRESRPKLGPEVTVPPQASQQRRVLYDSRDSRLSGSQMSQHESASDDYEKLVFNPSSPSHQQQQRTPHRADQRRGSLDAVVMMSAKDKSSTFTYGEQQSAYDTAYPPVHLPSRSFDATGHISGGGGGGGKSGGHVRPTPPSSHHSQESRQSPRPPVSPVSPTHHPPSRASSAKNRSEKRPPHHHHHHHVRNHSQPAHTTYQTSSSSHHHPSTQPNSQSPSNVHQRHDQPRVSSDDNVFQSAYPGHRGAAHYADSRGSRNFNRSSHVHNPRAFSVHQSGRGRYYSDMHSRIVENEPYQHTRHHSDRIRGNPNYTSDESNSRQSTPIATPTLMTKSSYVSGNDSGFDSMNRGNRVTESTCIDPGAQYVVELRKNPTLGLGITGGVGGENAIKPGDTGFHVYKIPEGLPAHQCGKIDIGDKLLSVNGHDVSSFSCEDVLALLTQSSKTVILVLRKEPSLTLL